MHSQGLRGFNRMVVSSRPTGAIQGELWPFKTEVGGGEKSNRRRRRKKKKGEGKEENRAAIGGED